jgi:hypothetical protein
LASRQTNRSQQCALTRYYLKRLDEGILPSYGLTVNIKKRAVQQRDAFKKTDVSGALLKFSFLHFDHSDEEMCPAEFTPQYTQSLMRRLRAISNRTVEKFERNYDGTIKNHAHDWSKTARPGGFGKLKGEFRDLEGWQFCLENRGHGRVHGVMAGDTFYVIWLDLHHGLYPDDSFLK